MSAARRAAHQQPGTGYRMIHSAVIRNFRCFEHATLDHCRRINIIVGNNASGKTALLEALFLALGPSPEIAVRFRNWRGYERSLSGTQQDIEEAMWSDLFHGLNRDLAIDVEVTGSDRHNRSLTVVYEQSDTFVPITEERSASAWAPSPISFTWIRHDGREVLVRPQFTGAGYHFIGAEHPALEATFFASTNPYSTAETLKRFSILDKRRGATNVINDFTAEFPFVRDVDIQPHAGVSMLHADIPTLPEKVPLSAISSGVNKFATLLFAIAAQPRTVVFVDEIENGLYYNRLVSIWKSIYKNCRHSDVQLFASTHSRECLEALAEACQDTPDDVSLIRTEMIEGAAVLEQFDGSAFFPGVAVGEFR